MGASNISGPNFMVEDETSVQASARKEAIDKAKEKAEKLADSLGVSLVRITSFNEGSGYPMYYARGGAEIKSMAMDAALPPQAANIPAGQNKYSSSVTITYEIK